jgi:hypothetical protein
MKRLVASVFGVCIAVGGCDSKVEDEKIEDKKSVAVTKAVDDEKAPAAKAPATAASACPAGTTGGGEIPFCMTLPAEFAAGKVEKRDAWMLDFEKPGAAVGVSTKWTESVDHYDAAVEAQKAYALENAVDKKLAESGELAGGKGAFVVRVTSAGADKQQLVFDATFKGSKYLIECSVSWWTDQPEGRLAVDACKSLVPQ